VRILIDECLPHQIRGCLTGHDSQTVKYAGYGGYENGELLKIAEIEYDLFITSDKNLRYQQNLQERKLAILLLSTNDRDEILRNAERILATVNRIIGSEFVELEL
jgi:predicted nuclease of predicted toxin-antitoxin system